MASTPADLWQERSERARTATTFLAGLAAEVVLTDDGRDVVHRVWFAAPDQWRIEDEAGLLVLHSRGLLYRRASRRGPRVEATDGGWAPGPELGYLGWGDPQLFLDPPLHPVTADHEAPTATESEAREVAERLGREVTGVRLRSEGAVPHLLDVCLDEATGLPLSVVATEAPYATRVRAFDPEWIADPALFDLPAARTGAISDHTSHVVPVMPGTIPGVGEVRGWRLVDHHPASGSFVALGQASDGSPVCLARTAHTPPPSRPLVAASGASIGERAPRHVYAWHDARFSYELLADAELDQRLLCNVALEDSQG